MPQCLIPTQSTASLFPTFRSSGIGGGYCLPKASPGSVRGRSGRSGGGLKVDIVIGLAALLGRANPPSQRKDEYVYDDLRRSNAKLVPLAFYRRDVEELNATLSRFARFGPACVRTS
jgi:hypothetical protein